MLFRPTTTLRVTRLISFLGSGSGTAGAGALSADSNTGLLAERIKPTCRRRRTSRMRNQATKKKASAWENETVEVNLPLASSFMSQTDVRGRCGINSSSSDAASANTGSSNNNNSSSGSRTWCSCNPANMPLATVPNFPSASLNGMMIDGVSASMRMNSGGAANGKQSSSASKRARKECDSKRLKSDSAADASSNSSAEIKTGKQVLKLLQSLASGPLPVDSEGVANRLQEWKTLRNVSEAVASSATHSLVLASYARICELLAIQIQQREQRHEKVESVTSRQLLSKAAALYKEAISLQASLRNEASVIELHARAGHVLAALSKTKEAEKEFSAAILVMKTNSRDLTSQVVPFVLKNRPLKKSVVYGLYGQFLLESTDRLGDAEKQLELAFRVCNAKEDAAEYRDILLSLARVRKSLGLYKESYAGYQMYLSNLVENGESDAHHVTFEMARLLHYQMKHYSAAMKCYETACELSLEEVQRAMDEHLVRLGESGQEGLDETGQDDADTPLPQTLMDAMQCQGIVLYNAAMCYLASPEHGVAHSLGVFEESLAMLDQCGKADQTARVRLNYARSLCSVGLFDQAIRQYLSALRVISSPMNDSNPQIGEDELATVLYPTEVHGHLAHCLQYHVTDYGRAAKHYKLALTHSGFPSSVTGIANTASPSGDAEADENEEEEMSALSLAAPGRVRGDVMCWILECYSDCCVRLKDTPSAIHALLSRIKLGSLLGDACVSSYVRLANAFRDAGDVEGVGEVLKHLVMLPKDTMTTCERYCAAINYASHLENCGKLKESAQWFVVATKLTDSHPGVLVRCAAVLSRLPNYDHAQVTSLYMKAVTHLEVLSELGGDGSLLFHDEKQSNQLEQIQQMLSKLVSNGAGEDLAAATTKRESASAAGTDEGTTSASAVAEAEENECEDGEASFHVEKVEETDPIILPPFVIFGMAAAHFHTIGSFDLAERLYQKAFLSISNEQAILADPTLAEHLCTTASNYAKLLYGHRQDNATAQTYFDYAVSISPESFALANHLADFYLDTGNHSKGFQQVVSMIDTMPSAEAGMSGMYHKLARLAEHSLNLAAGESKETVLRYYVLSLGIPSSRVPSDRASASISLENTSKDSGEENAIATDASLAAAPSQPSHNDEPVPRNAAEARQLWEDLLMEGMSVCTEVENAINCLTFLHRTLNNPVLASKCHRVLIPRFPNNTTLLSNYATLCCEAGAVTLARKLLARAYALESNSATLMDTYCTAVDDYFPQHAMAAEAMRRNFVRRQPQNASGHMSFAGALITMSPSYYAAASRHHHIAISLAPQNAALYAIAASLADHCVRSIPNISTPARKSMEALAEMLMEMSVAIAPNDPDKVLCMAIFYSNRGEERVRETLIYFERALEMDPHNFTTITSYATFLHNRCVLFRYCGVHPALGGAGGVPENDSRRGSSNWKGSSRKGSNVAFGGSQARSAEHAFTSMSALARKLYEKAVRLSPLQEQTLAQFADFERDVMRDGSRTQQLLNAVAAVREHKRKSHAQVQHDLDKPMIALHHAVRSVSPSSLDKSENELPSLAAQQNSDEDDARETASSKQTHSKAKRSSRTEDGASDGKNEKDD